MRKLLIVLLLSNILLFAKESLQIDNSMPWMMTWLIASLMVVGLMFWSIYKAMKTKNPKYGYGMALAIFLMIGLMFI